MPFDSLALEEKTLMLPSLAPATVKIHVLQAMPRLRRQMLKPFARKTYTPG
jgi:hypothetical protein